MFLPKVLIVIDAALRGRARGFGGAMRAAQSTVAELVFSSLTAPLFLMFQTRSVLQVVRGADGGWPAQSRGDGTLSLADAWAASHWIVTSGVIVLGTAQWFAPNLVLWLLPVALPMLQDEVMTRWHMVAAPLPEQVADLSARPARA